MKHFLQAINDFMSIKGRMTLNAFFQFMLFFVVFWVVALMVDQMTSTFFSFRIVLAVYNILMIPTILSAMVRRLHDTGNSGKWVLLLFAVAGLGTFLSFQSMFQISISNATFTTNVLLLLLFIAISTFGILIYKLSVAGNVGANKYGPDPMEVKMDEVEEYDKLT